MTGGRCASDFPGPVRACRWHGAMAGRSCCRGGAAATRPARCRSAAGHAWSRSGPAGGITGSRNPVRLSIRAFMERDIEGEAHWFTLNNGQWVQGLVARNGAEQRVYVVTITPQMPEAVHERWPRVITA